MRESWHRTVGPEQISEVNIFGPSEPEHPMRIELAQWIMAWPGWSKEAVDAVRQRGPSEIDRLRNQVAVARSREAAARKKKGRTMLADDLGRYEPAPRPIFHASWTGAETWLETMKYCEEGP